jgi:hypothetical protein
MAHLNTEADIAAFVQTIQEDAILTERNLNFMGQLVTVYRDASGLTPRSNHQYNQMTAQVVGEADDLTSSAFTPAVLSTLTPFEIGLQFMLTDSRRETDTVENIVPDANRELGLAATDKVEADLLGLFPSLTGGEIGAAGSALTWGKFFAAAARCRVQLKSESIPLTAVLHEYQWYDLAKSASIAGSSIAQAPQFTDSIMANWYRGTVSRVNIFVTSNTAMLSGTDAYGAIFARDAIALDWRRPIRIEPDRDPSRRAWEFNMSAVYAKGVWRPTHGIQIISDATAPED